MKENLNSKEQIYFNFLLLNIFSSNWLLGQRQQVLQPCFHGGGGLHHRVLSPGEDEEGLHQLPPEKNIANQTCQKNSFVSPQKKSSQRSISSSVSASAHSGSPELLYLVIKLVVYQCLCPCMFISFSLLGSSCSSLVACPTSLLENAQPDHPPS